jgi:hypothetical protein
MVAEGSGAAGDSRAGVSTVRRVAIGCFTSWLGFCSGAMVAALLSKFASFLTRAQQCEGIPACNWYVWAGIGGVVGAITLPFFVLRVLGRPIKDDQTDRGF